MILFLVMLALSDSSWVRIQTLPTEVILVLNEDLANPVAITSGDSLKLPVGKHAIRVMHPTFADSEGGIEVLADQVLDLRIDLRFNATPIPNTKSTWFVLRNQANIFVQTDEGTKILLDGKEIGIGEVAVMIPYDAPSPTLVLRRGRVSQSIPLPLKSQRSVFVRQPLAPSFARYWLLSPIPGATQIHERRWLPAAAIITATLGSGVMMMRWTSLADEREMSYQAARERYEAARDFDTAELRGQQMEASFRRLDRAMLHKNAAVIALGTVLSLHVLDVAIPPKYGFRKVTLRTNPYQTIGAEIHLGF